MVILCPLPSIVRMLLISGRGLASVIVLLMVKTIVSVPLPTAQTTPVVSTRGLLALLIAPRRVHLKKAPGSAAVLTVIVAACSADGISTTQSGTSIRSIASEIAGRADAA